MFRLVPGKREIGRDGHNTSEAVDPLWSRAEDMPELRARVTRLPVIGALVGVGIVSVLRRRRHRRPTGAKLMAMDDPGFAAFIESAGLKTATTAGLDPGKASTD